MEQNSSLVERAISFALRKHNGQLRKDGLPYITHPLRVSEIVKKFKKSHRLHELMAAAILHDTLEDTDTTFDELKENFGELVALIVLGLTNDKIELNKVGKSNYLCEKLSCPKKVSRWALVIKLADRLDNVSDLDIMEDRKFAEKIKKETYEILNYLEENRELTFAQKRLVQAIKDKLKEVAG